MIGLDRCACHLGIKASRIDEFFNYGPRVKDFEKWMRGQTFATCEAHGEAIIYEIDFNRFMMRLPIVD